MDRAQRHRRGGKPVRRIGHRHRAKRFPCRHHLGNRQLGRGRRGHAQYGDSSTGGYPPHRIDEMPDTIQCLSAWLRIAECGCATVHQHPGDHHAVCEAGRCTEGHLAAGWLHGATQRRRAGRPAADRHGLGQPRAVVGGRVLHLCREPGELRLASKGSHSDFRGHRQRRRL